jgi:hypothetical protein
VPGQWSVVVRIASDRDETAVRRSIADEMRRSSEILHSAAQGPRELAIFVADRASAQRLAERLGRIEGVDGAFAKPPTAIP